MTDHPIPSVGETQCDIILARLRMARGAYVPMPILAAESGAYAVHSRISDLRRRGHHIPRPRLTRADDGTVCSEYCLVEE